MIKVLVYDDNASRRESLQLLIDDTPFMKCVGTFEDCSHVIEDIESTKPDVVLMDIDMPNVNGIEGEKNPEAIQRPADRDANCFRRQR